MGKTNFTLGDCKTNQQDEKHAAIVNF